MIDLVRVEIRKAATFYAATALLLVGYALLRRPVLSATDPLIKLLAAAHGYALARALFSDPGHSRSFMFSRAPTRRRLFYTRWATGLALQALTLALVALCLASGLRETVQDARQFVRYPGVDSSSPYYPMVKWFEFNALRPIVLWSVIAYQVTMFAKVWRQLECGASGLPLVEFGKGARFYMLVAGLGLTSISLLPLIVKHLLYDFGPDGFRFPEWLVPGYALSLAVLATAAGASCYRDMEVEG